MPMLHVVLWLLVTQPQTAEPQRLKSSSELVVLNVAVTEGKSGYVAGLPREAFAIFEDGRPQPLGFFENADTPATIGLVIDGSTSMHRRREAVIAAATSFAASSHPDDEMFIVNFNEHVSRGLPEGQL